MGITDKAEALEKAAVEKDIADKAVALEKIASEKVIADKSTTLGKAVADEAFDQILMRNRSLLWFFPAGFLKKVIADKPAVLETGAAEKIIADRAALEKAAAEKALADNALEKTA